MAILDGAVHSLDLTIGAWMFGLGEAALNAMLSTSPSKNIGAAMSAPSLGSSAAAHKDTHQVVQRPFAKGHDSGRFIE